MFGILVGKPGKYEKTIIQHNFDSRVSVKTMKILKYKNEILYSVQLIRILCTVPLKYCV